jgi:hypothetical protein
MIPAAALVTLLLLVTLDLDRPTRGLITVPSTPLASVRASMALPPAAKGPTHRERDALARRATAKERRHKR